MTSNCQLKGGTMVKKNANMYVITYENEQKGTTEARHKPHTRTKRARTRTISDLL
jgi:hypothetical protein